MVKRGWFCPPLQGGARVAALLATVSGVSGFVSCGQPPPEGSGSPPPEVTAAEDLPFGDWAGWIYLDGGSDLPVRVHLSRNAEGEAGGTVTLPSEDLYAAEVVDLDWTPPELVFAFRTPSGRRIAFTGRADGPAVGGRVRLSEDTGGDFEMFRSFVSLPDPDPDAFRTAAGVYRGKNGWGVGVEGWFWGEPIFTDLDTGARGTLFRVSSTTLFAGRAMYMPDSVTAWATFVPAPSALRPTHLVWQRGTDPPLLLPRVEFREEELTVRSGDVDLSGTLLLPPGAGPYPAAVLLGGSGWGSRAYSREMAQIFASSGVAAFIYDKRGYGDSGGERTVSFEVTAGDAVAAVERVSAHPEIRSHHVGLAGTSRGGWFAPLAASRSEHVAFLILWVSPAVSPAEQETTRRLNLLRQEGATEEDLAEAAAYLERLWAYGRTSEGWEEYAAARRRVMERGWTMLGGPESSDPEEWLWTRLNAHYDPIPALERVRVPVLAIYGGADPNVVPEQNAPLLEAALRRAGNSDVTVRVIPAANHVFRLVDPADPVPRIHRAGRFAPESWQWPVQWLRERF